MSSEESLRSENPLDLLSQTFRIVSMAKRMNYGRTSRASLLAK